MLNANHTMLSLTETPIKEQVNSPGFPKLRELYIAVDSRYVNLQRVLADGVSGILLTQPIHLGPDLRGRILDTLTVSPRTVYLSRFFEWSRPVVLCNGTESSKLRN